MASASPWQATANRARPPRRFSSQYSRRGGSRLMAASRRAGQHLVQGRHGRPREGRVIDVIRYPADDAMRRRLEAGFQGPEQGLVRLRIVEGLPGGVQGRDAALRQQQRPGPGAPVEPLRHVARAGDALVGRGAHQRDLRGMRPQPAPGVPAGHRFRGAEIDHVQGAHADHGGNAVLGDGVEAAGGRRIDAAQQADRPPRWW